MESPGHSALAHGHLREGRWFCECELPAICRTTRKSGSNYGRKFWRCTNSKMQCDFFLWVDHEDGVREWLRLSQPQPVPETPTKSGTLPEAANVSPKQLETPFTKAKRKEPSGSDEVGPEAENSPDHSQTEAGDPFCQTPPATEPHSPSGHARKASRTSIISTPGQNFVERLQSCTLPAAPPPPLPTPSTHDHPQQQQQQQYSSSTRLTSRPRIAAHHHQRDGSPTPIGCHHNNNDDDTTDPSRRQRESDLTATVLDLVRADHPNVKDSTEMQIRHEIGLVLDVGDSILRRHERTIAELLRKVDELEAVIAAGSA